MLLRVRDEARMTITAYETLYESSIAYGVRKALVAEQKRIDLDAKLRELAMAKRELQQQVESLKNTIEATQARSVQKRDAEEKAHSEDVRSSYFIIFIYLAVTVFLLAVRLAAFRHCFRTHLPLVLISSCTCMCYTLFLTVAGEAYEGERVGEVAAGEHAVCAQEVIK